jgi:pimeloyl-ACP methyl ester carboxylesterase
MRVLRALLALLALVPLGGCLVTQWVVDDAERRFPDRGEHVVAEGVRLRYVEKGSGRPIVLLHGAFGGLEDYEATILDDVALRGRAVAFDRPGHGWSRAGCGRPTPDAQAAILRAACSRLGIERPVVVGFSYGGAVAASWASLWPDEVSGLVLLNGPTHAWGGAPDPVYRIAGMAVIGDLFTWNVVTPLGAVLAGSAGENAFAPEAVPASFARSPIPLAIRPAQFRQNAAELEILDLHLETQALRYGAITCPVVFVVGEGDRIVGPEFHSPRWLEALPETKRVVVPGAGHQLLFAHPDVCVQGIDDVLEMSGPAPVPVRR